MQKLAVIFACVCICLVSFPRFANAVAPVCCFGCSYPGPLKCCCAPPRPALTVIKTKYATFTRTATAWKKNGPAAAAVLESALPLPLPLPLALPPAPAPVSVSVEEDQVDHAFARHLCPLCPPGKNANRNRNCCKRRKTVTRTVRKTRTVTRKRIVTTTRPTIKNQVVSGRVYIDNDGSGTYTPGDLPLAHITLLLVRIPGTRARSSSAPLQTTSDANGFYAFPPSPVAAGDVISIVEKGTGTVLQDVKIGANGLVPEGGFTNPVAAAKTSTRTETAFITSTPAKTGGPAVTTSGILPKSTKTQVVSTHSEAHPSTLRATSTTSTVGLPGQSSTPQAGSTQQPVSTSAGAQPTASNVVILSTSLGVEAPTTTAYPSGPAASESLSTTEAAAETASSTSLTETETSSASFTETSSTETSTTQLATYTAAMVPGNLLRGGPTGTPLAVVVEKNVETDPDGFNVDMYNSELNQFTGEGSASFVYEVGPDYLDDEDKWNSANGNAVFGVASHPNAYGVFVVDMKVPRYLDRFSVFQTFNDGKLTHMIIARHWELGDTPPSGLGDGWTDVGPEIEVPVGSNMDGASPPYVGGPAKVTVEPFVSRYLKLKVKNNGTYGDAGYIEVKGIKGFGGPIPTTTPTTTQSATYTAAMVPGNLLRGGPTGTPLAVVVEKNVEPDQDGFHVDMYNSELNQFTGEGSASFVYEVGPDYLDDEDKWNSANGNAVFGVASHPNAYGVFVVDMKVPRYLDRFSVFQTFNDGKLTHMIIARHWELGDTPPSGLGDGWTDVGPEIEVPVGSNMDGASPPYVGGPAKVTVAPFVSRYLKLKVKNNGTYGDAGYIEVKGIKGFGGPAT